MGSMITDFQASRMRALWLTGMSVREIAENLCVSTTAVWTRVKDVERDLNIPTEYGEEWTLLTPYSDRYYISNLGRVYSTGGKGGAGKLLPTQGGKHVPRRVYISIDAKSARPLVAPLVAMHFCSGFSNEAHRVRHIDGDLSNDCHSNLEWTVDGDHFPDDYWRRYDGARKRSSKRRPTDCEADEIKRMWMSGGGFDTISRTMGIRKGYIAKCVRDLTRDVKPPVEEGEVWVRLPNDKYYVSSHGRLFNNGGFTCEARLMRPFYNEKGYASFGFDPKDGSTSRSLHRLVATYFCEGHSEVNDVVNHIDGNPSNNHADNLEWCTQSDNILHAVHVLGRKLGCSPEEMSAKLKGRPNRHQRKLTDEQVREIRDDPRSSRQLATVYGVDKATINRIRSRESCADVL